MIVRIAVWALAFSAYALADGLTLVDTTVSDVEGGPAVAPTREFGPGERVHLRFKVAGFHKGGDTNQVFFEYSIEAVDCKGIPFDPPLQERFIARTTRSESRYLTYSFLLPVSPAPCEGKLRIAVQDRLGDGVFKTEVPFKVRSNLPEVTDEFRVTGFRYYRSEFEETALTEPVYRPGDKVWGRFYLSGFEWTDRYRYKLSYGVTLRNRAGKVLFKDMEALSESRESFYPKWNVAGVISVQLDWAIRPGEYSMTIDARDENSGKTAKAEFPIRVR